MPPLNAAFAAFTPFRVFELLFKVCLNFSARIVNGGMIFFGASRIVWLTPSDCRELIVCDDDFDDDRRDSVDVVRDNINGSAEDGRSDKRDSLE